MKRYRSRKGSLVLSVLRVLEDHANATAMRRHGSPPRPNSGATSTSDEGSRPTPVHRSQTAPIPELPPTTDYSGVSFADPELPCHGCGHSAAEAPFPGFPSGERPCGFCVRNTGDRFLMDRPAWYDGTPPFKTPMDCYIATDRSEQQRIFNELHRLEQAGQQAPPREKYPSLNDPEHEVWCCEGGDGPQGHSWTCWRWLGVAFG